jgi:hypothetical protein
LSDHHTCTLEPKMNARSLAAAALLVVFSAPAFCQSPPTFEIADVHAAAYTRYPFTRPSTLVADRYSIKDATMVDLIADAWSVDAGNVQGGPACLEGGHEEDAAGPARRPLQAGHAHRRKAHAGVRA